MVLSSVQSPLSSSLAFSMSVISTSFFILKAVYSPITHLGTLIPPISSSHLALYSISEAFTASLLSFSCAVSSLYISVPKSFLNIACLSSPLSTSINSPCAIIETCINWLFVNFIISSILALVSLRF